MAAEREEICFVKLRMSLLLLQAMLQVSTHYPAERRILESADGWETAWNCSQGLVSACTEYFWHWPKDKLGLWSFSCYQISSSSFGSCSSWVKHKLSLFNGLWGDNPVLYLQPCSLIPPTSLGTPPDLTAGVATNSLCGCFLKTTLSLRSSTPSQWLLSSGVMPCGER